MAQMQPPRGCPDWLPEDFEKADWIFTQSKKWAHIYQYKGYKTPIFEQAQVFTKSLGEDTDIITKEMYSFQDKKGETFVLRPEATAPLARLFLSHKLQRSLPLKMFTYGPMFRYERPQKGRQRQFHQIGFEHLGAAPTLFSHFEILSLAWNFLKSLNLSAAPVIELNGLGSSEERASFKKALVTYLTPFKAQLSEDSQKRLLQNPLRILDSKKEQDQTLLKQAPKLTEFVSQSSQDELKKLMDLGSKQGLNMKHNPLLVRGLDYYNDLVFEVTCQGELGAQNTILAGGRYDRLIESMGGPKVEALGFGAGLERLMILAQPPQSKTPQLGLVFLERSENLFSETAHNLRAQGVSTFTPTSGNFSKKMQKCQKAGCKHVLILGEKEIQSENWTLKTLESGEQKQISKEEVLSLFD